MSGDFQTRMRVFLHYAELTKAQFQEGFYAYYKPRLSISIKPDSISRRAHRYVTSTVKGSSMANAQVGEFLRAHCLALGKDFDPAWFTLSFEALEQVNELRPSFQRNDPDHSYSSFQRYWDYVSLSDELLRKTFEGKRLQRDFVIYRVHSTDQMFVQDVLRIHGYENGTGRCTLYQYSTQSGDSVKEYSGNMFVHDSAFYLFVAADPSNEGRAPEFGLFVFPHDLENSHNYGMVCGLTDHPFSPISSIVRISNQCERRFSDPRSQVRPLRKLEEDERKAKNKDWIDDLLERFSRYILDEQMNPLLIKHNIPLMIAKDQDDKDGYNPSS